MNWLLYEFPQKTKFGRILPKAKIYAHAAPGSRIKNLFVQEVEKITWSYKLAPETINLPAKSGVQEIQIFTIVLKTDTLRHEVLQTIDKAIPSPILFRLSFGNQIRYVAAYKRQNEADRNKWVVSRYFETSWQPVATPRTPLPVALDLAALYHTLLKNILPLPARPNETIECLIDRLEQIQLLERDVDKIESRLKKEKQFNRKVEINAKLRKLKHEIERFKQ